MHYVVGGCGRVGSQLAILLSLEGHDVVVVDTKEASFDRLGSTFNGSTIIGNVFDPDTLDKAEISKAAGFAAVTDLDNTNIMAAQVAKKSFKVPIVIARLYNPDRQATYEKLGLDIVCGTVLVASSVKDKLISHGANTVATFPQGQIEIVRLEVKGKLAGKKIDDLEKDGRIRIAVIQRDGTYEIPKKNTELEEKDLLVMAISANYLSRFIKQFKLGE